MDTQGRGLVKVAGPPPDYPRGRLARLLLQGDGGSDSGPTSSIEGTGGSFTGRVAQVSPSSRELGRFPDR